MKVRLIKNHEITGYAERFNTHGMGEMIVGYTDGDMSSEFINDYEVQLADGIWMNMNQAFKEKKLITDNYDTVFREPKNEEEKLRGYYL